MRRFYSNRSVKLSVPDFEIVNDDRTPSSDMRPGGCDISYTYHLNSDPGMSVIFTVYGLPKVAPSLMALIVLSFIYVGKKIAYSFYAISI